MRCTSPPISALKRAHKERRGLLARCFGRRIYRHRQFSGELPASAAAAQSNRRLTLEHEDDLACENEDDFHSPMRPDDYIALRVRPKLAFYRARIPHYARRRTVLRCFLFACTASGSIIAYLANEGDLSPRWAVVVTAAAAAFTSWMEFADIGRKVERYTRAVVDIQNLLSSWKSLSDVERSNQASSSEEQRHGSWRLVRAQPIGRQVGRRRQLGRLELLLGGRAPQRAPDAPRQ